MHATAFLASTPPSPGITVVVAMLTSALAGFGYRLTGRSRAVYGVLEVAFGGGLAIKLAESGFPHDVRDFFVLGRAGYVVIRGLVNFEDRKVALEREMFGREQGR